MASQTLSDIASQIKQAADAVMKRPKVGIGQSFIAGALAGGVTAHQSHPFPSVSTDPETMDAAQCDAWADQAEDANQFATYPPGWDEGMGGT